MAISVNISYKSVVKSNTGSSGKTASNSKATSSSKSTSSSKATSSSKSISSSKSASSSKATGSKKAASNSKAGSVNKLASSSKSASSSKATNSNNSASISKTISSNLVACAINAISGSKSANNTKEVSSYKVLSSSNETNSSTSVSSSKKISNSKPTSSKATSNSNMVDIGSAVIIHNPTISYTATTSTYKIADSSNSGSTYKPPAGYYNYKIVSSSKDLSSINAVQGNKKPEVKTIKNTIINKLQTNLKSVLKTSKISHNVTIQAVKKKVEKSLSESVLALEKSRDYLKRLTKVIKYDLDVASEQLCNEIENAMDKSRKLIEDKDIFGKKAINLILDGCEKLSTSVVKGTNKHSESFANGLLNLTGKIVQVIGKIIDAVNPAPNQLPVSQIIEEVEKGKIKLENNLRKGNYGEMKMDQYFEEKGYVRINIDRVMSLDEPVHQGIDGIYYNVDKQKGEPTYIIGEAKYNQSKLGYTKYDGKQMSDDWILGNDRIVNAVGEGFEKEVQKAIMKGELEKQVIHIFPDGTKKVEKINKEGKVEK